MGQVAPLEVDMAQEAMAVTIARDNDIFRRAKLGKGRTTLRGDAVATAGINAMDDSTRAKLFDAIRDFAAFSPGDDPYGEHDFIAVTINGVKVFAKIDYYDSPEYRFGCEDPSDPAQCYRLMTIMLAEEY